MSELAANCHHGAKHLSFQGSVPVWPFYFQYLGSNGPLWRRSWKDHQNGLLKKGIRAYGKVYFTERGILWTCVW